jgi:hypothetical protein
MDLADIGGETKVLGDIGMVLGWMIAKCDKAYPEIFWTLKFARLKNIGTDGLDILCCR